MGRRRAFVVFSPGELRIVRCPHKITADPSTSYFSKIAIVDLLCRLNDPLSLVENDKIWGVPNRRRSLGGASVVTLSSSLLRPHRYLLAAFVIMSGLIDILPTDYMIWVLEIVDTEVAWGRVSATKRTLESILHYDGCRKSECQITSSPVFQTVTT